MSAVEDKIELAKRQILGEEPPLHEKARIPYNLSSVALVDYIRLFEETLASPQDNKSNLSQLFFHMAQIEFGEHHGSKNIEKIENDIGIKHYAAARKRFVEYYKPKVPIPTY